MKKVIFLFIILLSAKTKNLLAFAGDYMNYTDSPAFWPTVVFVALLITILIIVTQTRKSKKERE